VLVVDDNSVNRLIVREMVSACGAVVAESADGEEALAAIRDWATPVRLPFLVQSSVGICGHIVVCEAGVAFSADYVISMGAIFANAPIPIGAGLPPR
jgi:CheY-like chemotaxis protein